MELTDVLPFQAEPRVSKTSPVLKTALELYGSSLAVLSITVDELGAAMDPYSKLIPTSFLSPRQTQDSGGRGYGVYRGWGTHDAPLEQQEAAARESAAADAVEEARWQRERAAADFLAEAALAAEARARAAKAAAALDAKRAEKAAAEKASAEKAASDRLAVERKAADKAALYKAIADKAIADEAIADEAALRKGRGAGRGARFLRGAGVVLGLVVVFRRSLLQPTPLALPGAAPTSTFGPSTFGPSASALQGFPADDGTNHFRWYGNGQTKVAEAAALEAALAAAREGEAALGEKLARLALGAAETQAKLAQLAARDAEVVELKRSVAAAEAQAASLASELAASEERSAAREQVLAGKLAALQAAVKGTWTIAIGWFPILA